VVGSFPRGLTAGFVSGVAIVGLATLAHEMAGGTVHGTASMLAMVVVVLGAVAVAPRLRWTFPRVLCAAFVVQPVLHTVLATSGHGMPAGDMALDPAGHEHAMAMSAMPVQHQELAMWGAHATAALVVAVVLRWAVRWLRSMPELIRAIVYAVRVSATAPLTGVRLALAPALAPASTRYLLCESRGPPAS
jgi:hypothetical protein